MATIDSDALNPHAMALETPMYVVIELRQDSGVGYSSEFHGAGDGRPRADELNRVLREQRVRKIDSHFRMPPQQIRARVAEPRDHDADAHDDFAHAGFVQIHPRRAADADALVRALQRIPSVWHAQIEPRTVPAGTAAGGPVGSSSRRHGLQVAQGHLASAPYGVGACHAWQQLGGAGQYVLPGESEPRQVSVGDIEGNWDLRHVDLPRGVEVLGGQRVSTRIKGTSKAVARSWKDHGTAVLGILVGQPHLFSSAGICHRARAVVQAQLIRGKRGNTPAQVMDNAACAIRNACKTLGKGDVLLLELQAQLPDRGTFGGPFVPCQFSRSVFSAIRYAIKRGVTVIEPAANNDLDLDELTDGRWVKEDAGAIMVGAGVPPTNWFAFNDYFGYGTMRTARGPNTRIGAPRSRIWFSNYGTMVNVQAWGMHVATLGYGDAHMGARRQATLIFAGTSSASAIVAGAGVCMQGHAWSVRGEPLSTEELRSILMETGSPQVHDAGSRRREHIGPQPDLERALEAISKPS